MAPSDVKAHFQHSSDNISATNLDYIPFFFSLKFSRHSHFLLYQFLENASYRPSCLPLLMLAQTNTPQSRSGCLSPHIKIIDSFSNVEKISDSTTKDVCQLPQQLTGKHQQRLPGCRLASHSNANQKLIARRASLLLRLWIISELNCCHQSSWGGTYKLNEM